MTNTNKTFTVTTYSLPNGRTLQIGATARQAHMCLGGRVVHSVAVSSLEQGLAALEMFRAAAKLAIALQ